MRRYDDGFCGFCLLFVFLQTETVQVFIKFFDMQKKIVFSLLFALMCFNQVLAQINGVLKDAKTGEPIMYANVFYEGKGVGAITDMDGRFQVDKFPEWKELTFSSVGYDTKKVPIDHKTKELIVELNPSEYTLNEVIVKPKTR